MIGQRFQPFTRLLILPVILFALGVSPLRAQDALTQTIQLADGELTLSISYPDGWVAEATGENLFVASSAAALDEMKETGFITSAGALGIVAYPPGYLDRFDLPHDAAPSDALTAFLESIELEGTIKARREFAVPAATVLIAPPDEPDVEALVGALAFPDGTVMFGAMPNRSFDTTALAVVNSISLSAGEGGVQVGEPQTLVFSVEQAELAITVPAGWVYDESDDGLFLYFASSESALDFVDSSDPDFQPGEIGLSLALPGALAEIDLSPTSAPDVAIRAIIEQFGVQGKVLMDNSFDVPAARARLTGDSMPGGAGDVYALAFDSGTLLVAVQPADADEDTVLEILHTIRFGEPSGAVEGGVLRQWATSAEGSSQYGTESWSFMQVTGEPDTPECGDITTAWASESSTGKDFLVVGFDQPIIPTQINIYQTYNPGSIIRVGVGSSASPDQVLTLPDSADPPGNTDCPGVFALDVSGVDTPIDIVIVYLDQSIVGSWNEIDAVELVGTPAE